MRRITKQRICQVEGCKNVLKKTEGLICQMHRSRKFRHGTFNPKPHWRTLKKGEPCLTKYGYFRINVDGKRILQHRYVMEQYLGRKLQPSERIHHINGDKTDNRIENLELMNNNAEHMKKYHPAEWKKRKNNGELSAETIHNIIDRVFLPFGAYNTCFCGKEIEARNLCPTHYEWAHRHKIFRPKLEKG